jgi:hypothetical protein
MKGHIPGIAVVATSSSTALAEVSVPVCSATIGTNSSVSIIQGCTMPSHFDHFPEKMVVE